MFKWLFGKPKNEGTYRPSAEDQIILDMYASYEDIRFARTDDLRMLDEYQKFNKRIEAAEALLAIIPSGKFSDIRTEVADATAIDYQQRGWKHSLQHKATHPDNIRAIADFSRAIELSKLADKEPELQLFEARGACYLYQKMPDKAIEDANSMIKKSECAEAYLLRGEAHSQIGNYVRAKDDVTYAMEIATRIQEKHRAFDLYSKVCSDIVNQHRLNLEGVVQQYKAGKRNFRGIDLSWIDLSNIDLSGADLQGANLECSDLRDTNFSDTNLYGANLKNCINHSSWKSNDISTNFQNANLESANLRGMILVQTSFQSANLCSAHMPNVQLGYANFKHADLTRASLVKAELNFALCENCCLNYADLSEAKLGSIDLSNAELIEANLSRADLQQAKLVKANLGKANLSKANLFEAIATYAQFSAANLSGAILAQADFSSSNLQDANVVNANLYHVNLTEANITRTNLIQAEDLRDVQGISESIIQQWRKRQKY